MKSIARILASVSLAIGLGSAPALAAFDPGGLSSQEARTLMDDLIHAGIAGMNCPGLTYPETANDLLNAAVDQLAAKLGISTDALDDKHYKKAFDAYDQDTAGYCAKWGPRIGGLLDKID